MHGSVSHMPKKVTKWLIKESFVNRRHATENSEDSHGTSYMQIRMCAHIYNYTNKNFAHAALSPHAEIRLVISQELVHAKV